MGIEKNRIPLNLTRYNSGQNCYGNHKECEIATLYRAVGRSENLGDSICLSDRDREISPNGGGGGGMHGTLGTPNSDRPAQAAVAVRL